MTMQQNFFDPESHLDNSVLIDPSAFFTVNELEDTDSLPVESDLSNLHEDGLASGPAIEALGKALILMNHRKAIVQNRGIGLVEVASIESHVPGLLRYHAPLPFTYERSKVNMEWALEAVDEKIQHYLKLAGQAADKIIAWISERIKKLRNWYIKIDFAKKLKNIQVMMRPNNTVISVADARSYLGENEFNSHWYATANVTGFNSVFKTKLTPDDFDGVRTGDKMSTIINVLANKEGATAPAEWMNIQALEKRVMECMGQCGLIVQKIDSTKMLFDPRLAAAGNYSKEPNAPVGTVEFPSRVPLTDGTNVSRLNDSQTRKILDHMAVLDKNIEGISKGIKAMDNHVQGGTDESMAAYKKIRASMYDSLRNIQLTINYVSECLTCQAIFTGACATCGWALVKASLSKAKGQNADTTVVN